MMPLDRSKEKCVRILIVDDDHVSLLAMARPLRKAGYDVVEAMRAEQIVDDAEEGRYDVIIMSIFMPGMGGISAIERIHKKDPTCKIVAVTGGYADMSAENAITAAKKIGAVAGFSKPVNVSALMGMVKGWVEP